MEVANGGAVKSDQAAAAPHTLLYRGKRRLILGLKRNFYTYASAHQHLKGVPLSIIGRLEAYAA
jgi:hypothetical protein